jgi:hypothetical protein
LTAHSLNVKVQVLGLLYLAEKKGRIKEKYV